MSIFKEIREKVAKSVVSNGVYAPNVGLARLVPVMLCPSINEYNLYMYQKIDTNEQLKQKIAEKGITIKLLMKSGNPVGVDTSTLTPADMLFLGFKNPENDIDKNMFTYTGSVTKEAAGKTTSVKELNLVLYFEVKGSNRPLRHNIKITNEISRNKDGDKTQYINNGMKSTWSTSIGALPEWFTTITDAKTKEVTQREFKPLFVGEQKLYDYLTAVNSPNSPYGVSSYKQIKFFDLECFFEDVKASNKEEITARKIATMQALREDMVNIVIQTTMPDGKDISKEVGVLALLGVSEKRNETTNVVNYNQVILSVNNATTFVPEIFTAQSMMHYENLSDIAQVERFVRIYETEIKRKQQGDVTVKLTPLHKMLDKLFGLSDNVSSALLSRLNRVKNSLADAIVYSRYEVGVSGQSVLPTIEPSTEESVVEDPTDGLPF